MDAPIEPGLTTLIARAPRWQRVQRWPALLLLVAGVWSLVFGFEPVSLLFIAVGFWGTAEFWRGLRVTGDTVVAQGRMVRRQVPLADVLQVGQTPGRTLWLQAKGRRTLVLRMAEVRVDEEGGLVEIQQRLRDLAAAAGATLDEPLEERVAAPRPRTPLFGI
ncbi:hypothetical protein GCM10009623_25830 [Nocardioides aestuarii]|uniref:PH domain-containing protein n=1 Tax=Nocardioides aestuarii TaxID=252231 RepID=A0ABW4TQ18_9ACTN